MKNQSVAWPLPVIAYISMFTPLALVLGDASTKLVMADGFTTVGLALLWLHPSNTKVRSPRE